MNNTSFDEPAIGSPGSMARKIQVYEHFLKELFALGGLCIYGCNELMNASDEVKDAFRMGSSKAYNECSGLAESALTSKDL